jgi:acyl-coenzyme A synthetase/AMP-(fatty) acid ligase
MRNTCLRDYLRSPADCGGCHLVGAQTSVLMMDALRGTSLGGRRAELSGRSVLLYTHDQLAAALAILELDGIVQRLVICPPDMAAEHLSRVVAAAGVDAIVSDRGMQDTGGLGVRLNVRASAAFSPEVHQEDPNRCASEWVLLTSGTTGVPKMLAYDLGALTAAIKAGQHQDADVVWGTFYDIRRYGGLQIFLRAIVGRSSLVISDADESPKDHLLRLGTHAVTHLTGTPSHWRRVLMSPSARAIAPRYIRLSGEIADQAILNSLRSFFPKAAVGHAFASTEAGVSFEINDGLEGFPATLVGVPGEVEIKIEDGSLRVRSSRNATCYVGEEGTPLVDADGFVDTGDMVEQRGDRYFFLGRKSGVINVGGLKVYPEEVEVLLNRHPAVRMSRVGSKRNPITGALVVADIVLKHEGNVTGGKGSALEQEILKFCRDTLPRHKVPAALRFVPALAVAESGKMVRSNA